VKREFIMPLISSWLIAALIFNIGIISASTPPEVTWEKFYTYRSIYRAGYAHDLYIANDGGLVIVGSTFSEKKSSQGWEMAQVYLQKTDFDGNLQWQKGIGYDEMWIAAGFSSETSDGGYIITGSITYYDDPLEWQRFYLLKVNDKGEKIWEKEYRYGKKGYRCQGQDVIERFNGGYIVVGTAYYSSHPAYIYLLGTDVVGNLLWKKQYGNGCGYDEARTICRTRDGNYLVIGIIACDSLFVMKIDDNGDTLAMNIYGDYGGYDCAEFPGSIQPTSDGNYVIGGTRDIHYAILKVDQNGDTLWTRTYPHHAGKFSTRVKETIDGGYILISACHDDGNDACLFRTDPYGNELYTKTLGTPETTDYPSDIIPLEGGYIFLGVNNMANINRKRPFTIWLARLDGEKIDNVSADTLNQLFIICEPKMVRR